MLSISSALRFLFVTTVTLRLLRLHLRMYARDMPNSTYEFATSFPRLILLGLTDVTSPSPLDHEHPLEMTLYKLIRFPALLSACINYGDGRKGYGRNCGISFFGTHYLGQNAAGRRTEIESTTFCDIVRLDVRPGACILRKKGWPITAVKGWHATFCGVNFELVIAGDVEETGLEETLRTVLGHLALYATSEQVTQHQKRIRFKVTCLPRILDRITELVSPLSHCVSHRRLAFHLTQYCCSSLQKYDHVQPCFLDFKFCLTSPVNKEDMQRYFRALASVYRQYWATHAHTHDSTKEIRFTDIDAPATALHPAWIQEYDLDTNPEADQYWSAWGGNMWCGPGDVLEWNGDSDAEDERDDVGEEAQEEGIEDDAEDDAEEDEEAFAVVPVGPVPPAAIANRDPLEGFEVNLYRTLMYKDELENSHMIWARGYPLAMPARAIDEL